MTNYKFSTLCLKNPRLYRSHLSICDSASLSPPTNYILTLVKPFSYDWYVIPLLKTGALALTCNIFLQVYDEKTQKNWRMHDQFQLLAAILAWWQCPVASTKALGLLHCAMHAALYRHTAAAIEMASKVGPFFHRCFVCCCPGSPWDNTEQVVT